MGVKKLTAKQQKDKIASCVAYIFKQDVNHYMRSEDVISILEDYASNPSLIHDENRDYFNVELIKCVRRLVSQKDPNEAKKYHDRLIKMTYFCKVQKELIDIFAHKYPYEFNEALKKECESRSRDTVLVAIAGKEEYSMYDD